MSTTIKILIVITCIAVSNEIFSQNWHTDLEYAKKIAVKENKPIVLVFQGSDWCAPCIKLERDIWSSDFQELRRVKFSNGTSRFSA